MTESRAWYTFERQDLGARFRYPATTEAGETVEVDERPTQGARVHVLSADHREVYFEVVRFPHLTLDESHGRFLDAITSRLEDLQCSELERVTIAGSPGQAFTFWWPGENPAGGSGHGFERRALFTEQEEPAYRVILDPRSPTNTEILASLEFLAGTSATS